MLDRLTVLEEPALRFTELSRTYGKVGLSEDGPYSAGLATHPRRVLIGIIGRKDLVYKTMRWLETWEDPIESRPARAALRAGPHRVTFNKALFPDFPGLPAAFHTSFVSDESLNRHVEAADWTATTSANVIDRTVQVYESKLVELRDVSGPRADLVVLVLPAEVTKKTGDYHSRLRRPASEDANQLNVFGDFDGLRPTLSDDAATTRDLRGALKCMAMRHKIPVQILTERTLVRDDPSAQNDATKVWNLSTGMFYKAGHLPWILAGTDKRTCFLGLSYYHSKTTTRDIVTTSVAQLFSNEYESPIIRGSDTPLDADGNPHLDYGHAFEVIKAAVGEYRRLNQTLPKRIVMHKSWPYSEDEVRAYGDFLGSERVAFEALTLAKSTLRLLRYSKWPVPRGSFVRVSRDEGFLYTKGYVPELQTYPGVHIPAPFLMRRVAGESDLEQLSAEVLALTKLNWNSADYCSGLPLTLGFARNVGKVLRELRKGEPWEGSYRFYM